MNQEKYMMNQLQLENELMSLRKEFTVLEKIRNRGSYTKLAKVTEIYKREAANVLTDLMRVKNPGRQKEDAKMVDDVMFQMTNHDLLEEAVTKTKEHIKEVEDEIKAVKKSVNSLAKQQITDRQHQDRIWAIMKTVEALDNKLEVQMIKFGVICTKNKALREEIDHLLWERRNFILQWNKFIKKLTEGKQIMLDLIEQATIAYNQREEWVNKLQALRIKAHQELLTNMHEMREYIRKDDQNLKVQEYFLIKGQKREMRDLKLKLHQKRLEKQTELTEKLQRYHQMIKDIKHFTKEKHVDKIAKQYIVQDEYNLSNFKYVMNELREMELIGDKMSVLHLDIEEKNLMDNTRRHQQQKSIQSLEEKLNHYITQSQKAVTELEQTENYLKGLLDGVLHLFRICKCDKDPLLKLLGHNESVADYNVTFYIDILESKIQELLVAANYQDKTRLEKRKITADQTIMKPDGTVPIIHTIEKVVNATPCSICVEYEMVADVIDVLQTPITREIALSKLKRRLKTPGGLSRLHTLSNCQLPQSRKIMQKRYQ